MRAMLQQATSEIHETMHRLPGFVRVAAGTSTKDEYFLLLRRLLGFHGPLERALRAADSAVADGRYRKIPCGRAREKSSLLRADLTDLGATSPDIVSTPLCKALPAVTSGDEIMGCLYVIEGAALGGKQIARALDGMLGAHTVAARRFFLGRPDPDPLPWVVFCRLLESHAANGDPAATAASARRTFESMSEWLHADGKDV
jgi:heme oxygenase